MSPRSQYPQRIASKTELVWHHLPLAFIKQQIMICSSHLPVIFWGLCQQGAIIVQKERGKMGLVAEPAEGGAAPGLFHFPLSMWFVDVYLGAKHICLGSGRGVSNLKCCMEEWCIAPML